MGGAVPPGDTGAVNEARHAQEESGNRPLRPPLRVFAWLAGLALVLGVLEWQEWPFLRSPLESALAQALHREVTIGPDFGIRFIGPIRLRSDLLVIGPAPEGPGIPDDDGKSRDLLRAAELRLAISYATLFSLIDGDERTDSKPEADSRKRPYIDTLEVAQLDLALARSADGEANWRFGQRDKKDTGPLVLPEFGRLAMGRGVIVLDDALTRLQLEAAVHTLEGASAALPGDEGQAAGLEVSAKGHYRGQPLSARLRSSGLLPLADASAQAVAVPLRLEIRIGSAELDFDGSGRDVVHLAEFDGQFRLAGRSLAAVGDVAGVTLPTTAPFVMRGKARKDGAIWSVGVGELSVGSSRLNGDFRYDPTPRVAKLSGRLGGARLSLPDLGPAVGAPAKENGKSGKSGNSVTAAGRVLPQREFDIPSLAAMDADVRVALDEFDLGTAQLEKLSPLNGHILLENQVLTLREISAHTSGGQVDGSIALDARQQTPLWKADLRWSGVQLERFVKPRNPVQRKDGPSAGAAAPGYISGILGGRARVHGTGRSTAQMLATLGGEVQLRVHNGRISNLLVELTGLDVAESLGFLLRGDETLPIPCALAGLNVREGKVWPEVAVIETSDSTISAAGVISLADERLGLVFKAQPKDWSPLTLRSPVFIEGTFADPDVRLDKASIGKRLAAAAALAAATPVAALLALFDLGEPEKGVCAEALERIQRLPGTAAPAVRPKR